MSVKKFASIIFALALITGLLAACASPTPTADNCPARHFCSSGSRTGDCRAGYCRPRHCRAGSAHSDNCSGRCIRYPFLPG